MRPGRELKMLLISPLRSTEGGIATRMQRILTSNAMRRVLLLYVFRRRLPRVKVALRLHFGDPSVFGGGIRQAVRWRRILEIG